MLVKSAKDTRSSADKVKAHSGEEMVRRRTQGHIRRANRIAVHRLPLRAPRAHALIHWYPIQECRAFKELSMFLGTPEYRDSEVIGIDEARPHPSLAAYD